MKPTITFTIKLIQFTSSTSQYETRKNITTIALGIREQHYVFQGKNIDMKFLNKKANIKAGNRFKVNAYMHWEITVCV